MAITASAKKAIKRSRFLRARNLIFKESMKKSIKLFKKSVLSNESNDVVQANLVDAYSAIDKAARKNIIHKNNAARKKSRLAKMAVAS
jgi:small subunit ribosomal protein S20